MAFDRAAPHILNLKPRWIPRGSVWTGRIIGEPRTDDWPRTAICSPADTGWAAPSSIALAAAGSAELDAEPPDLSAAFASSGSMESMLTLIAAVSVVGAVVGAGSFATSGSDGDGNGSAMAGWIGLHPAAVTAAAATCAIR
eukprot:2808533-Prymnesium_polylepis.1